MASDKLHQARTMPRFHLTVVQRIAAGFLVLGTGLIIVAAVALSGIADIQRDVNRLVDQASPVADQTNELSLALTRIDQLILAHYNAESSDALMEIETEYVQERDQILDAFDHLVTLVEPLAGSDDIMVTLDDLNARLPDLFERIEDNQRVYRESLERFSELDEQRINIRQLAAEIDEVLSAITGATTDQTAQALMYQAHVSLRQGFNLANRAGAARSVAEFADIQNEFRAWMNDYGALGFELLRARNMDAVVDDNFEALGEAVSRFLDAATSSNGLLPTVNEYRQIRASLTTRIDQAQSELSAADTLLRDVRGFASDYQARVNQDSTEVVSQTQWVVIGTGLGALLTGLLIALVVTRSIRQPLRSAVAALGRIAQGDLSDTWQHHSRDEFGDLTRSAEQVVIALRNMVTTIQEQSDTLDSTVTRAHEVSTRMQSDVSDQREQTEWVASAIHEMSATIEEVARNADQASGEMTNATDYAQDSQRIVAENQAAISDLVGIMAKSVEAIQNLDQEVHTIQDILQVIEGIAEQTNLLALNAAIEAARAGEQGRGFAVVADEVRSLASRTQSSTVEIKHKIDTMLTASGGAVSAIEQGQSQTGKSAERSEKALSVINEFAEVIGRIRDLNLQIATAAEEQAQVSGEINENVSRIASVAEQTEQGARHSREENERLHESYKALRQAIRRFQL